MLNYKALARQHKLLNAAPLFIGACGSISLMLLSFQRLPLMLEYTAFIGALVVAPVIAVCPLPLPDKQTIIAPLLHMMLAILALVSALICSDTWYRSSKSGIKKLAHRFTRIGAYIAATFEACNALATLYLLIILLWDGYKLLFSSYATHTLIDSIATAILYIVLLSILAIGLYGRQCLYIIAAYNRSESKA